MKKHTKYLKQLVALLMIPVISVFIFPFSSYAKGNFQTDNVIPEVEILENGDVEIDVQRYCDASALEHADEEYLRWFADYIVNCVMPQATRDLLQIPVFQEAVENGQISDYITVKIIYNEENPFAAMYQSCSLGYDGNGLAEWDSPMYALGNRILVNLYNFGPGSQDDEAKKSEITRDIIHEMMHAYATEYLFNLSMGTDKYGARVMELDENGEFVNDETGYPVVLNVMPMWFQEGIAETVQAGYGTHRDEFMNELFMGGDSAIDEMFASPESMFYYIQDMWTNQETGEIFNAAHVTNETNTYSIGYVACLYLYSMTAEKLGYTVFDEDGTFNTSQLIYGLSDIFKRIHDGASLDQVIFEISYDEERGESVYTDTTDFEQKFLQSVDDPGIVFWMKMMRDFEGRHEANPDYIPSGSVLPGFENYNQLYMDDEYHPQGFTYEVANAEDDNPYAEYFSISTIRMSSVALGGGRIYSYDPYEDALSDDEIEDRDSRYIGDTMEYYDINQAEQ